MGLIFEAASGAARGLFLIDGKVVETKTLGALTRNWSSPPTLCLRGRARGSRHHASAFWITLPAQLGALRSLPRPSRCARARCCAPLVMRRPPGIQPPRQAMARARGSFQDARALALERGIRLSCILLLFFTA